MIYNVIVRKERTNSDMYFNMTDINLYRGEYEEEGTKV